jgi:hypothetical protein
MPPVLQERTGPRKSGAGLNADVKSSAAPVSSHSFEIIAEMPVSLAAIQLFPLISP